ncbi:MAG: hypothetical protein KAS87_05970, partial [Candidatus Omnitrophica bacterium]|nr:hypothetical protein [Candidatus Omnitrophota bacterium]
MRAKQYPEPHIRRAEYIKNYVLTFAAILVSFFVSPSPILFVIVKRIISEFADLKIDLMSGGRIYKIGKDIKMAITGKEVKIHRQNETSYIDIEGNRGFYNKWMKNREKTAEEIEGLEISNVSDNLRTDIDRVLPHNLNQKDELKKFAEEILRDAKAFSLTEEGINKLSENKQYNNTMENIHRSIKKKYDEWIPKHSLRERVAIACLLSEPQIEAWAGMLKYEHFKSRDITVSIIEQNEAKDIGFSDERITQGVFGDADTGCIVIIDKGWDKLELLFKIEHARAKLEIFSNTCGKIIHNLKNEAEIGRFSRCLITYHCQWYKYKTDPWHQQIRAIVDGRRKELMFEYTRELFKLGNLDEKALKTLEEFKKFYALRQKLPRDLFNREEIKNFAAYNFVLQFIKFAEIRIIKREGKLSDNDAKKILDEILYYYSAKPDLSKNIWNAISEWTMMMEREDGKKKTFIEKSIDFLDEKVLTTKTILFLTTILLLIIYLLNHNLSLSLFSLGGLWIGGIVAGISPFGGRAAQMEREGTTAEFSAAKVGGREKDSTIEFTYPLRALAIQELLALIGHSIPIQKINKPTVKKMKGLKTVSEKEMFEATTERLNLETLRVMRILKKEIPLEIWEQIGSIIGFLHKNGLGHRDFAIRNMLVGEKDGKPHIYIKDMETANLLGRTSSKFGVEMDKSGEELCFWEGIEVDRGDEVENMVYDFYALTDREEELEVMAKAYEREFTSDPMTFRGEPIHDMRRLKFVRDIVADARIAFLTYVISLENRLEEVSDSRKKLCDFQPQSYGVEIGDCEIDFMTPEKYGCYGLSKIEIDEKNKKKTLFVHRLVFEYLQKGVLPEGIATAREFLELLTKCREIEYEALYEPRTAIGGAFVHYLIDNGYLIGGRIAYSNETFAEFLLRILRYNLLHFNRDQLSEGKMWLSVLEFERMLAAAELEKLVQNLFLDYKKAETKGKKLKKELIAREIGEVMHKIVMLAAGDNFSAKDIKLNDAGGLIDVLFETKALEVVKDRSWEEQCSVISYIKYNIVGAANLQDEAVKRAVLLLAKYADAQNSVVAEQCISSIADIISAHKERFASDEDWKEYLRGLFFTALNRGFWSKQEAAELSQKLSLLKIDTENIVEVRGKIYFRSEVLARLLSKFAGYNSQGGFGQSKRDGLSHRDLERVADICKGNIPPGQLERVFMVLSGLFAKTNNRQVLETVIEIIIARINLNRGDIRREVLNSPEGERGLQIAASGIENHLEFYAQKGTKIKKDVESEEPIVVVKEGRTAAIIFDSLADVKIALSAINDNEEIAVIGKSWGRTDDSERKALAKAVLNAIRELWSKLGIKSADDDKTEIITVAESLKNDEEFKGAARKQVRALGRRILERIERKPGGKQIKKLGKTDKTAYAINPIMSNKGIVEYLLGPIISREGIPPYAIDVIVAAVAVYNEKGRGYNEEEIVASGLVTQREIDVTKDALRPISLTFLVKAIAPMGRFEEKDRENMSDFLRELKEEELVALQLLLFCYIQLVERADIDTVLSISKEKVDEIISWAWDNKYIYEHWEQINLTNLGKELVKKLLAGEQYPDFEKNQIVESKSKVIKKSPIMLALTLLLAGVAVNSGAIRTKKENEFIGEKGLEEYLENLLTTSKFPEIKIMQIVAERAEKNRQIRANDLKKIVEESGYEVAGIVRATLNELVEKGVLKSPEQTQYRCTLYSFSSNEAKEAFTSLVHKLMPAKKDKKSNQKKNEKSVVPRDESLWKKILSKRGNPAVIKKFLKNPSALNEKEVERLASVFSELFEFEQHKAMWLIEIAQGIPASERYVGKALKVRFKRELKAGAYIRESRKERGKASDEIIFLEELSEVFHFYNKTKTKNTSKILNVYLIAAIAAGLLMFLPGIMSVAAAAPKIAIDSVGISGVPKIAVILLPLTALLVLVGNWRIKVKNREIKFFEKDKDFQYYFKKVKSLEVGESFDVLYAIDVNKSFKVCLENNITYVFFKPAEENFGFEIFVDEKIDKVVGYGFVWPDLENKTLELDFQVFREYRHNNSKQMYIDRLVVLSNLFPEVKEFTIPKAQINGEEAF